jgi:hypothetical protein
MRARKAVGGTQLGQRHCYASPTAAAVARQVLQVLTRSSRSRQRLQHWRDSSWPGTRRTSSVSGSPPFRGLGRSSLRQSHPRWQTQISPRAGVRRLLINGASANLLRSRATKADPWMIGLRLQATSVRHAKLSLARRGPSTHEEARVHMPIWDYGCGMVDCSVCAGLGYDAGDQRYHRKLAANRSGPSKTCRPGASECSVERRSD